MTQIPAGAPTCYGTQWSATASECVGGPDPAYTHPQTGAHVRERCGWYQSCAATSANARTALIQPSSLIRSLPQPPPPPTQVLPRPIPQSPFIPPKLPQPYAGYSPVQQQPQYPYQVPHQMPYNLVPPWIAQQGPTLVPVQYQQPGSQISSYLTVPEPTIPGENWFLRLFREIFRSIFKASAHTTASFFDHTPIREHKPPPPPPPQ